MITDVGALHADLERSVRNRPQPIGGPNCARCRALIENRPSLVDAQGQRAPTDGAQFCEERAGERVVSVSCRRLIGQSDHPDTLFFHALAPPLRAHHRYIKEDRPLQLILSLSLSLSL